MFRKNGEPSGISIVLWANRKYLGSFLAHRLAFVMMDVTIPDGMEIDHKNRNPWDNRWENLRLATSMQNGGNKVCKKSKSLPKGVNRFGKKYVASIAAKRIGAFDTPLEAAAAYHEEAVLRYGEFARTEFTAK